MFNVISIDYSRSIYFGSEKVRDKIFEELNNEKKIVNYRGYMFYLITGFGCFVLSTSILLSIINIERVI